MQECHSPRDLEPTASAAQMILGQSLFDAVLERLKEEAEDAESETAHSSPRSMQIRGFSASFVAAANQDPASISEESHNRLYYAYSDADEDGLAFQADTAEKAFDPTPLLRLTPEEVAEDLGIKESDTSTVLLERRRQFARINHPDRVPESWRDNANMRMKLANLLIDEAVKRHKLQS